MTADEAAVAEPLRRIGRFCVFLCKVRAELFDDALQDDAFQAELAAVYQPRRTTPVPRALLAMVLLLQAYDQAGDAEAVVAARVDQRWQLVVGYLGTRKALERQRESARRRDRVCFCRSFAAATVRLE